MCNLAIDSPFICRVRRVLHVWMNPANELNHTMIELGSAVVDLTLLLLLLLYASESSFPSYLFPPPLLDANTLVVVVVVVEDTNETDFPYTRITHYSINCAACQLEISLL